MWLSLLGMIPGFLTLATSIATAWFNTKVSLYQAKTGAAKEVAVAAIQAQAAVQEKWWFAAVPPALIGFSIALYIAKAVVWDKVVGSFVGCSGHPPAGTCTTFATDAMGGDLHWVLITVITGYFSMAVADKWFNSK